MSPAVIGITSDLAEARWHDWSRPAAVVPTTYVDALERCGAVPVILPPLRYGAQQVVALLDGLVLSGGDDIDPAIYGAHRHPATTAAPPGRDAWELALLFGALKRDLPVLGICRGMQLMSVMRGGTLVQHLPDVLGHHAHRPAPGSPGEHVVRFAPGSRLCRLLGESLRVADYHHQAVARPGHGVQPVGWADDGTIEAIELPQHRFAVGFQGHPEEGDDLRVFEAMVEHATATPSATGRRRVGSRA